MLPLRTNAEHRAPVHQLLVVGPVPFGDLVANTIADMSDDNDSIRVIYAETLVPGARKSAQTLPVDMVCFVVSMRSKLSMDRFRQSVEAMVKEEQSYFVMGRWALVVLDSGDDNKFALPLDEVQAYANECAMPIVFVSHSKNPESMQTAAQRIQVMLQRASREQSVSPMFMMC